MRERGSSLERIARECTIDQALIAQRILVFQFILAGSVSFSDRLITFESLRVIWRCLNFLINIGTCRKYFSLFKKDFSKAKDFSKEHTMKMTNCAVGEDFEISSRFRQTVEKRIARLEKDAEIDEAQVAKLEDDDHIRRQMRLVALQRAEALRMRLILDRANTASPGL